MESANFDVVAAIDFGTTFSGYAYSFKNRPEAITTSSRWDQLMSSKTSTSLLLKPGALFHSFGFEAEEKYADVLEDGDAEGWAMFRKFKMKLYDNQGLSPKTTIRDYSGKVELPLLKVLSMAIKHLKDEVIHELQGAVDQDRVLFVLTVPAIWDDRAKFMMRLAASEADIRSDRLVLALESEVASIWCRNIPLNPSGEDRLIDQEGAIFMVVDLGGGTADITIHEVLESGRLRECERASGGDYGGTKVDDEFMTLIEKILGKDAVNTFKEQCLSDLFCLLRGFEVAKRGVSDDAKICKIQLPSALCELSRQDEKQLSSRKEFTRSLNGSMYGKKVHIKSDKLQLDNELSLNLFGACVNGIVKKLEYHFSNPRYNLSGINPLIFVGGFSESSVIQTAVRKRIGNRKILFPPDGGLAVVKGAVLYGHRPGIIAIRKAKYTYGLKICEDFDPNRHDPSRKRIINGKPKVRDVFRKYIEIDEDVKSGYSVTERTVPQTEDQLSIVYELYATKEKSPEFVTDTTCFKLGEFRTKTPRADTLEDREIERTLIFGDTEITLKVKHLKTGFVDAAQFSAIM